MSAPASSSDITFSLKIGPESYFCPRPGLGPARLPRDAGMSVTPIPEKKGEKDLARSQIPLGNEPSPGAGQLFGAPPFGRNGNVVLFDTPSKPPSHRSTQMASEQDCGGLVVPSSFRLSPTPSPRCGVNLGKSLHFHKPQSFHP